MIPVKKGNIVEIDNLPGEVVEFTISAGAAHLIMQSMSDLYSNRALAVIREYSTNAYDAHIEAGKADVPIDVTLPNEIHPFFTVRDQGVGMSAKTLKEVYTSFGESTRRTSDDFNGTYGYGSKSALAYTNTFTITAVKDSHKTIAIVTRNADEVMVLKEIVPSAPTTEPDGVTIEIPVSNIAEFVSIANNFYKFWIPGRVNVNGKPVENPYIKTEKLLNKDFYRYDGPGAYVVMGNVPYPVNNPVSLYPSQEAFVPFVAYVDNGSIEFTPSREALKYSEHTKKTLQAIVDDYLADIRARANDEVRKSPTRWEALRASRKWRGILKSNYKYRGKEIPSEIPFDGKVWHTYRSWQPIESVRSLNGGGINLDKDVLIITDATATVGTYQRSRVKDWKQTTFYPASLGHTLPPFVYWTETSDWKNPWVNPECIVSWEDIKVQTPPPSRAGQAGKRLSGSFDVLKPDGTIARGQSVTSPKFWVENWFLRDKSKRSIDSMLTTFSVQDDVIIVPANREAKFLRESPSVINVRDYFKSQIDLDGDSMYNDEQRTFFSLDYYNRNHLLGFDENKVNDKDLKGLIRIAKRTDIERPDQYEVNKKKAGLLSLPFKPFASTNIYNEIMTRYPLVPTGYNSYRDSGDKKHVYIYINAAYAARKDGSLV